MQVKEWITGAEAEYIEAPVLAGIEKRGAEIRLRAVNPAIPALPVGEQGTHVRNHRIIEKNVASIEDGGLVITDPAKIVNHVLNGMTSDDYDFILAKIDEVRAEAKKKLIRSNTSGPTASAG